MTDFSVSVKDAEDGYYVEFAAADADLAIQGDTRQAFVSVDEDFKIINSPYPGGREDYLYAIALTNSAVSPHLRQITILASTCLTNSSVMAILTKISSSGRAFSGAFSSAFR